MRRFGTFGGVFTPDVLTILGVIMYLRFCWVVGNAGFVGAVIITLLAKNVTIRTGLSMSSMTTNIKIGAGGAPAVWSSVLPINRVDDTLLMLLNAPMSRCPSSCRFSKLTRVGS